MWENGRSCSHIPSWKREEASAWADKLDIGGGEGAAAAEERAGADESFPQGVGDEAGEGGGVHPVREADTRGGVRGRGHHRRLPHGQGQSPEASQPQEFGLGQEGERTQAPAPSADVRPGHDRFNCAPVKGWWIRYQPGKIGWETQKGKSISN